MMQCCSNLVAVMAIPTHKVASELQFAVSFLSSKETAEVFYELYKEVRECMSSGTY